MAKLIINNSVSFLELPEEYKQILWKKLRFPTRDRHFNPFVASRQWDGYVEFFKPKTGRFLTGLLPEIISAIRTFGIEIEIQDNRNRVEFDVEKIDKNFIGNNIELFDYQVDYVNQLIKHQRGIIPAPTGSGKSLMFICLAKALKEKTPALFLANSVDLIEQTYEELAKYNIPNIGRFYGKVKKPNFITCSTVQSVEKLGPILGKIRALFVDEIHVMMTKQSKWLYSRIPNAYFRVGMSATAFKFGGKDLVQKYEVKGHFGPLLQTDCASEKLMTTSELQKRNILSSATCWFIPVEEPKLEYLLYQDAVTKGIAENEWLHNKSCEIAKKLTGRTLILVERVKQGDRLAEIFGKEIIWISGKDTMETRKEVIKKLKYSENCVAVATRHIFNTGIDFKIHNLINSAGGIADHMIIQRFGRGLRKANDKETLFYFDFYFKNNDYLEKHSKKRISILKKEGHNIIIEKNADLNFLDKELN